MDSNGLGNDLDSTIYGDNDVKHLILNGVQSNGRKLGRGAYGIVFEVIYNGVKCAAKQLQVNTKDSVLLTKDVPPDVVEKFKQCSYRECLFHSKLNHPNIVKMLGVYYPTEVNHIPPVLVMELMEYNLTTVLENYQNIPMVVKLSMLRDISCGVHYLHTLPHAPVIHGNLNSNNILLNDNLVVKISDFKTAHMMSLVSQANYDVRIVDLLRTSIFSDFAPRLRTQYNLSYDVFSFGCIICHVISQKWPAPIKVKPENTELSESDKRKSYISAIRNGLLKELVNSCLNNKHLSMSQVYWKITNIITSHYSNDNHIKMAYSLAIKQGVAESRDLQLLLVGSENTGKTCLISSLLNEKFVEGQLATKAVEVDICKIFCRDWTRIDHSKKTEILHHQCDEQLREKAMDIMETRNVFMHGKPSVKNLDIPQQHQFYKEVKGRFAKSMKPSKSTHSTSLIEQSDGQLNASMATPRISTGVHRVHSNVQPITSAPHIGTISQKSSDIKSNASAPHISASEHLPVPHPQDFQQLPYDVFQSYHDTLSLTLWDFPGQVIFHNTHSVFISVSGIVTITFNASMELTSEVVPHEGSPTPPECGTIISGIHYWLQVVDSMCSVEGKEGSLSPIQPSVILTGTHIDLLNPDIKVARKISKEIILPKLIEELSDKPYAQHLVGMGDGTEAALEQFCFFVSNKCRDEEIERLKSVAINASISQREKQPIYYLEIQRALLQHKEQVISKSTMANIIAKSKYPIAENSSEFEGVLQYFHEKRVILYFSQIKSLKNLVILSPQWLARLFSYIITAHSYKRGKGYDDARKRLNNYGILHEGLLQHMLEKFHLDNSSVVKVSKKQVVDILLCFHLVARITREAWFSEEGHPSLPDSGDTFIVPSLVPRDDSRNPPNTKQEKIIYFKFDSGFIPTSLLNQLIAKCICRNVERNSRLLWMRHGKVGLQLGVDQVYYISRCEEMKSIQLTITMPLNNDVKSRKERRELIDDITRLLDEIMEVFMPAVKKRPVLLVPCPNCPTTLHVTLEEVCSGNTIFCTASRSGKAKPLRGYYSDLLPLISRDLKDSGEWQNESSLVLEKEPLMEHFVEFVIPKIKANWENIAYILGFDIVHVEGIVAQFQNDVQKCCRKLLIDWLKSTSHEKTWLAFLVNLRRLDELKAAVQNIEQILKQPSVVEKYTM